MNKSGHTTPALSLDCFCCPHCGVHSRQRWASIRAYTWVRKPFKQFNLFGEDLSEKWSISRCDHCNSYAFWLNHEMFYPRLIPVEEPNPDMGENIVKIYNEAALILKDSPRASAALLRLAVQKICVLLGESGENLNTDIGNLVKKGLSSTIQQSLDILRVIGNNAVHPGQIDIEEEPSLVLVLFGLINLITDEMITKPKQVNELFVALPESLKNQVSKRDS